jgi:L-threonylcarbamoyladenylate synthase
VRKTAHLDARVPADVVRAAVLLRSGGLVAFATETVYGLGANALSAAAVEKIFVAKQRPRWDPLIVHLAAYEQVESVTLLDNVLRQRVHSLARAFWPGPLTLLLPRSEKIPDVVTAGRPLVGIRVPSHPLAEALLRETGLPIAAPSANRFGHTSPTTAAHVLADLDGRIDAVLDAGPASVGLESTVIDVTATPIILYRPGAITAQQIEAACAVPVSIYAPPLQQQTREPDAMPSPGVGIRHYAPRARVVLTEGSAENIAEALKQAAREAGATMRVGVLLPLGWSLDGTCAVVQPWGHWDSPAHLAASLYAGLRALDERGVELIVCPLPRAGGLNDAIRDRLLKSARSE